MADGLAAAHRWGRKVAREYRECVYGSGVPEEGTGVGVDETAMEWCAREGVETVILHASDEGRPLYERLGFEATNEMRLKRASGD